MKKLDLVTIIALFTLIQGVLTYFIDTRIDKKFYQLDQKITVLNTQYTFWLKTMTNHNWSADSAEKLEEIKGLLEQVVKQ